jgi:arsenate reductase (thioredoxin)
VSDRFADDLHRLLEIRTLVQRVTAGLHREFAGVFGVETIERVVDESYVSLAHARVQSYVPLFVERYARERLRAVAKVEAKMTTDKPGVAFLCVHNAGRSQMAAGWLQHLAGDQVEVFSGGSNPGSQINPSAVAAMAEVGIDIADAYPKQWTEEVLRAADVIITMGCGDACPIFPGKRYEDWSVPDPAGLPVEQVRPIRDEVADRVRKLVADLGLEPRA